MIAQVESSTSALGNPGHRASRRIGRHLRWAERSRRRYGSIRPARASEVQAAIQRALADIKATGKAAGILNFDPDQAEEHFAAGFDFMAIASAPQC